VKSALTSYESALVSWSQEQEYSAVLASLGAAASTTVPAPFCIGITSTAVSGSTSTGTTPTNTGNAAGLAAVQQVL
jgi:hypothetical protein